MIGELADSKLIEPTTRLTEDLGFDSLDRAELALQLEDSFFLNTGGPTISDEHAQGWRTVQEVVDCVSRAWSELRNTEGKAEKQPQ